MAELLIAASEECKCTNDEKLMENESNNATQDHVDTPGDATSSYQSMSHRVCVCVRARVCVHVQW